MEIRRSNTHSLSLRRCTSFVRLLAAWRKISRIQASELKYRMAQPNQPDLTPGRGASVLGFLNKILLINRAGNVRTRVNRRKLCFGNLRNQVAEVDFSFSSANEATRRTAQRLMRLQCPTRHPINLAGCRLRQTSKII